MDKLRQLNKRGGVSGSLPVLFLVTLAVIVLLVFFVLGSSFAQKVSERRTGIHVHDEAKLGVENIFSYMEEQYTDIVSIRVQHRPGSSTSVEEVLVEVGYES